ncbi:MAG: sulfite exporter TauE/SafE family protein [Myxococcota bacterium]
MTTYILLFIGGTVAGTLNVIAGGGSFLTIPLLMFLGLPATVANGTNRVAICLQNVAALWGFQRHKVVDWRYVLWAAVPSSFGALAGAGLAIWIGDQAFKKVLAVLMIAVTLWTLWDPLQKKQPDHHSGHDSKHDHEHQTKHRPRVLPLAFGFFLVGIYGGFVQAGVGFLILAATTLAGLDLVRGNAVKVLSILVYSLFALTVFAWQDKIDWHLGFALAAGNVVGSQIGVRFTVLKGHRWIKAVVTITVVALAIKLLVWG